MELDHRKVINVYNIGIARHLVWRCRPKQKAKAAPVCSTTEEGEGVHKKFERTCSEMEDEHGTFIRSEEFENQL